MLNQYARLLSSFDSPAQNWLRKAGPIAARLNREAQQENDALARDMTK